MPSDAASLVGTWALVATSWRRSDGRHANPCGEGATGILIYDAAGNMSAQVMRAVRLEPAAGDHSGIDSAMAAAVPGYIAYFGTYAVDAGGGVVRHRVVGATLPAWVGMEHARRFAIEGDLLTLADDVVSADGVAVAASTTWERMA
jgi:hypothetical protein